jgi:uncharacterized protein YdeI (YjbR/CyaY-like superfamily)
LWRCYADAAVHEIGDRFFAPDRETWRAWLSEHHMDRREVWLVLLKKRVARPCVTLQEAVEEALCFGWIDGHLRRIDDESHVLRFTPRGRRSVWAQSNKDRVERLIREDRMTPAGLAAVEAAKASGEWDAATAREDVDTIPDDLAGALRDGGVYETFMATPPSQRKQYLYWVNDAKRDETRRRRIAETVRRAREWKGSGQPPETDASFRQASARPRTSQHPVENG